MTNHIAKRKKKKRVRKPLKKSTLPVDPVSLKYQVKLVDGIFNVNDPSENLTPGKYGTIEDYEVELNSAREYTAFVKKIVRLVRGSYEYQEFIKFLGIELQIKNCAMLKGMNTNNVTIEVHHAVVTLYDICDTVIRNTSATSTEDDRFSSISLAGEVCKLHYEGLVPFTPHLPRRYWRSGRPQY